jgi:hypothetical protein
MPLRPVRPRIRGRTDSGLDANVDVRQERRLSDAPWMWIGAFEDARYRTGSRAGPERHRPAHRGGSRVAVPRVCADRTSCRRRQVTLVHLAVQSQRFVAHYVQGLTLGSSTWFMGGHPRSGCSAPSSWARCVIEGCGCSLGRVGQVRGGRCLAACPRWSGFSVRRGGRGAPSGSSTRGRHQGGRPAVRRGASGVLRGAARGTADGHEPIEAAAAELAHGGLAEPSTRGEGEHVATSAIGPSSRHDVRCRRH